MCDGDDDDGGADLDLPRQELLALVQGGGVLTAGARGGGLEVLNNLARKMKKKILDNQLKHDCLYWANFRCFKFKLFLSFIVSIDSMGPLQLNYEL